MFEFIFVPAMICAVVIFLVFAGVWFSIVKQREFDRKWPPIDEDEFIRRCVPGVNRERALRIRRIVAKQLGINYDQIYPEQSFVDDLDCG